MDDIFKFSIIFLQQWGMESIEKGRKSKNFDIQGIWKKKWLVNRILRN